MNDITINTQGTGELRFTKSRLSYRMWKYLGVPYKIFHRVPRGPQKREARGICYICYIAYPALCQVSTNMLHSNYWLDHELFTKWAYIGWSTGF